MLPKQDLNQKISLTINALQTAPFSVYMFPIFKPNGRPINTHFIVLTTKTARDYHYNSNDRS